MAPLITALGWQENIQEHAKVPFHVPLRPPCLLETHPVGRLPQIRL